MVKKRVWLVLLLLIGLALALKISVNNMTQKTKEMPLLANSEMFANIEESVPISDNLSLYDSKIIFHIDNIKWEDDGARGMAEVTFLAPDLEKIIKECIEKSDPEGIQDLINAKLESGPVDTVEYKLSMDVIKENGSMKLVPNDELIEIMNGSCDSILADLFEEAYGED